RRSGEPIGDLQLDQAAEDVDLQVDDRGAGEPLALLGRREGGAHRLLELLQRGAEEGVGGGDADDAGVLDQHAAVDGDDVLAVAGGGGEQGRHQHGGPVAVPREEAEGPAQPLGDDLVDVLVQHDRGGGGHPQAHLHAASRSPVVAASRSASSSAPIMYSADSGTVSSSPARIRSQPVSVSSSATVRPGWPVNASVTSNGWVRNRSSSRARVTT